MVINPDKCSFMLFGVKGELRTDLYLTTLLLKIATQKKYWESLLMVNLTFSPILPALPKR